MIRGYGKWLPVVRAAVYLSCVAIFFASAFQSGYPHLYADEEISLWVSERLWDENTVDTNFGDIPRIRQYYGPANYNFSSAILFAQALTGVIDLVRPVGTGGPAGGVLSLRLMSSLAYAAAMAIFFESFLILVGLRVAALAFVLATTNVQLFQDSLYARPESFVLLCFATLLLVIFRNPFAQAQPARLASLFGIGVLSGLLFASKFSLVFVLGQAGLLCLIQARNCGRQRGHWWELGGAVIAGATFGVILGAPFAVLNPDEFVTGVRGLLSQYGGVHLPFGRPDATWIGRAMHGLGHLVNVLGAPQIVLAVIGILIWNGRTRVLVLILSLTSAVFIGYFSQNRVFFERNYSLYLPIVSLCSAYAIATLTQVLTDWVQKIGKPSATWRAGVAFLVLGLGAFAPPATLLGRFYFETLPKREARDAERLSVVSAVAMNAGLPVARNVFGFSWNEGDRLARSLLERPPSVVEVISFGDPYSERMVDRLLSAHGYLIAARVPSALADVQQSMLHYYHARGTTVLVPSQHAMMSSDFVPLTAGSCLVAGPDNFETTGTFERDGWPPGEEAPSLVPKAQGSWLRSDSAVATQTLGPIDVSEGNVVLPFAAGPTGGRQAIELRDAASGEVLRRVEPPGLHGWVGWRLPALPTPVTVLAIDEGSDWGEWIAIGLPMLERTDQC